MPNNNVLSRSSTFLAFDAALSVNWEISHERRFSSVRGWASVSNTNNREASRR